MRPIKLTIEGFTSFAERAEIDFSDLDLSLSLGPPAPERPPCSMR
jgi:hypothetical protein